MDNTNKTTPRLLASKDDDNTYFKFELAGFNEVYIHDNVNLEALFVNRTYGSIRCKSKLATVHTFESFKSFCQLLYSSMLERGNGFRGTELDSQLANEIDLRIVALSTAQFDN